MDRQIILAVDKQGNFLEYITRKIGHKGSGKRHLAITVLIYNSQNKVLLQRRKHQVFNKTWDFTASTHPLHQNNTDETLEQATLRALKDEYDMENVSLSVIGKFNYFAKDGNFCENEHCYMLVGQFDGEVRMNPKVGYECKWVNKKDFLQDALKNPQNYAPWVIEGVKILKESRVF